ncbi:hypothetical protein MKW92_030820 [Papaver armeniacum]|nr:hypothetical protein MKW92_030820 [Papaver armeniacum]
MSLGGSSSVIVPLIHELVKENITEIPNRYIRTTSCLDHEYHNSDGDSATSKYDIPVIDVEGGLLSGESVLADSELHKLDSACQHWGFFQVVNHGISSLLIDQLKSEIHNLFELPLEEKTKIWQEAGEMEGFGQKFIVSDEQKLDWSDTFSITAQPIKMRKPQFLLGFHETTATAYVIHVFSLCREALEAYSLGLKNLTMILLGKMAKSLKIDSEEIQVLFNDCTQRMRINCYPSCPKSQQVIGLSPHSDAAALSIVLQLNETEGLEIRKDGKWVPVKPIPGALIVNLGDMIEILSNGAYPSIEHRVMVNPTKERLSIATFHSTNPGSEFGPALSLIDPPLKPALFRRETEKKYHENFFAQTLNGKTTNLDFMRINTKNGDRSIVPLVRELVKENITEIPNRYIRTTRCLDHEYHHSDAAAKYDIPVIDVEGGLLSGESILADSELHKLHSACQHWGFFQVVNHGISSQVIDQLKSEIPNLFDLPLEEKKKIWQESGDMEGFGKRFVVSDEQKLGWSDNFYITTQPAKMRKPQLFSGIPLLLREALEAYSLGLKNLTMNLLGKMAEALKMDSNEIEELFNDCHQKMKMICYPPCPVAQQVIGLSPHSDAAALSIVLQLNETEGLEIRKDGKWVPVKPIPGALIVNLGDMIEILSNGSYPSIEHRVMVNPTVERLSIATFHSTNPGSEFGPALSLIDPPHKPALFRRETGKKYYQNFFSQKLNGKTTNLDFMRITENGQKSS